MRFLRRQAGRLRSDPPPPRVVICPNEKPRNVALESSVLPEDKRTVSRNLLCFLERYQDGKGIPCKVTPGKECKIGFGI